MSRGTSQAILRIFTDSKNQPLTLDELVERTGLTRQQCTSAANTLVNNHTEMVRRGQGIYEWSTNSTLKPRTEMLMTIIMRKEDGTMLVKDTEDDMVYVIRPLDF